MNAVAHTAAFPYGFVGTFIEAAVPLRTLSTRSDFPSFWEGLSLRHVTCLSDLENQDISLPFWEGFH